MGMKKCKDCGATVKFPDGAPVWVLSYGDFVTNLMAFFVALLSFAQFDIKKFEAAASAMGVSFGIGFLEQGASINLTDRKQQNAGDTKKPLGEAQDVIVRSKSPEQMGWITNDEGAAISVDQSEEGIKIRVTDAALFPEGSAELSADAAPLLDRVSDFLKRVSPFSNIRVDGHSGDVAFFSALAGIDNITLSANRSITVYKAMEKRGVKTSRMSVAGYGSGRPTERRPGESESDWKARNRRVEIIVTWDDPKPKASAPAPEEPASTP